MDMSMPTFWSDPEPAPRDASLALLFARQAARTPDSPAVRDGDRCHTYRELAEHADVLARSLKDRGIRPGDTVGVLGVRSWEATVTAAGILGAGAVCLPVDAQYPAARSAEMLADGDARLTVVLPGHTSALPDSDPPAEWCAYEELLAAGTAGLAEGPAVEADRTDGTVRTGEDTAYVLFTSGTTGRPKPVAFPHRAVTRLAEGGAPWCAGEDKRVLQTFGLSFDGSLFETWATLLNGGCLVVADRDVLLDTEALGRQLDAERITHVFMTTSLFHHTVRGRAGIFGALDMVLIGGEAMDTALTRAVLDAGGPRHLINGYGPTEGGIMVTAQDVTRVAADAPSVSIGRPVARSSCHLLRPDGSPVAAGEEGEIFIGGDGVALGYRGRPEETERAFVTRTVAGGEAVRLYRSGDRARQRTDGTLEFLGRVDRQVKIRGFRVELEALEALLRAHPDVAEAAVLVRGNDGIGKGLSAYVTSADPARPADPEALRRHLRGHLPAHAIPAPLTPLDRFPLTDNGKIDYLMLGAAVPKSGTADGSRTGGSDDLVAGIWAEALCTPVTDGTDFFAEGGNSLLAAQVVSRTVSALGLSPVRFAPLLRRMLSAPTLTAYRAAAHAAPQDADDPELAPVRPDFEAEARLDLDLPPAGAAPVPRPAGARHILLTGATGFVGAFLLDRLLRDTDATVHCPVRAAGPEQAERRVHEALRHYGLPLPAPGRVRALPADLSLSRLGLAQGDFDELADTVDLVLHNAAQVNFLYPYRELRDANVEAVRTLIGLAGRRRVPLHYVSTTAVLAGSGVGGVSHVDESTPLSHPELISMGYPETKWVAERLLGNAASAGLPVTVHRPYEITGDSRTGAWNTDSAICTVFDAIVRLGAAPDVPLPLDLVPVDHVTGAIVGIATRLPHLGGVIHLTNPRPAVLGDMADRLRAAGHPVENVSYKEWVDALLEHLRDHPTAPIAPFAPLFVTRANEADFSVKEMYFDGVFPEVARVRTDQVWPDWHRTCPPVDAPLLDHYITHLTRTGLLNPPSSRAA